MSDDRPVRVRFAPSPTGDLHIGGVRTALFNWLFARRHGGKFVLRIEDTDQKRSREDSLSGIMTGLRWAGLDWDEGPDIGGPYGPYVQSERLDIYQHWAHWLVEKGKAYRAYETEAELEHIAAARKAQGLPPGYDRSARSLTPDDWARFDADGRPYVIRLKVPLGQETVFTDLVRGEIRVQNDSLQDAVLLKSDGYPTYHLAHLVDDHLMDISHVVRAEEWIASTPLHQILYEAFGWEPPKFAHAPVILHPSGGKISKRKHPEAAISYFINGGYLPEAVTNFLCNVGWNYGAKDEKGEEVQIFSKEDAAKVFELERMTPTGTKFDVVKLHWLNGEYIRRMNPDDLAVRLRAPLERAGYEVNVDVLRRVTPLIQERIKLLNDVVEWTAFFFAEEIHITDPTQLIQKGMTAESTLGALQRALDALKAAPDFSAHTLETALRALAEELALKPGQFFGAIRVATSAQKVSPPLFESLEILGREMSIRRVTQAIDLLKSGR